MIGQLYHLSTALEHSRLLLGNLQQKHSVQKHFPCAFYTLLSPTETIFNRLLNV